MNIIRRIRHSAAFLAGLAAALACYATATPAAFAMRVPPPGVGDLGTQSGLIPVRTLTVGGMPGWQITLIAIGAALLAATLAVLLDRLRSARRGQVTTSAG
jgi:hypothetical protein